MNKDTILEKEYEYIVQTTIQANEDRARVFEYFTANIVAIVGSFTIFSTQKELSALILILVIVFGFSSFLNIIKTRISWYESVVALNKIKDYYIESDKSLEKAFVWRTSTIPLPTKKFSISFIQSAFIAIMNSVNLALILYFDGVHQAVILCAALIFALIHLALWDRLLRVSK